MCSDCKLSQVNVSKYSESRVVAYGPGLEGGMVGRSANFTVETNGETGALGMSQKTLVLFITIYTLHI